MATIYNAEIKIVSDFCSYTEEEMKNKIKKALESIATDKKNNLTLRFSVFVKEIKPH